MPHPRPPSCVSARRSPRKSAARTGVEVKVGIVGCGLMGQKRARALGDCTLVACADRVMERAEAVARSAPGDAKPSADWRAVVERPDVDIVIVCVTHDLLPEVTLGAISAGKHALVEKPAARRARDLDEV